jgi:hypothetical protein
MPQSFTELDRFSFTAATRNRARACSNAEDGAEMVARRVDTKADDAIP